MYATSREQRCCNDVLGTHPPHGARIVPWPLRIFNIMREEGGADGGMVVQDCLELLNILLRSNTANQRLFRCGGAHASGGSPLCTSGCPPACGLPFPREAAPVLEGSQEGDPGDWPKAATGAA